LKEETVTCTRHGQLTTSPPTSAPSATGLYDPAYEHDACGVGFVAHLKGVASRQIVDDAERAPRLGD
jgi:glutamate synthase (NADPH) large chain